MNTLGLERFFVYMGAALLVFLALLAFVLRARQQRPAVPMIALALVVVVGGMTVARVTHGWGLSGWIFYLIPALVTFALPPLVLRMSVRELLTYVPLAVVMAPAIHICFSYFFGWHEYMPLFYVASWNGA